MQKKQRITAGDKVIGGNIKRLREAAGFSQYEIAKILRVSYQQIQKYEAGQNRFPIEKLFNLKNFYGVPYEIFFKGITVDHDVETESAKNHSASIYAHLISMKDRALKQKIEKIILVLLD